MHDLPPLTSKDVAEILAYVPSRPPYPDWIRVISGVSSVLSVGDAIPALTAWSPEERPGEYACKLRSPCERIGIGTVIAMATAHGFDASDFVRRRAQGSQLRPTAPPPARVSVKPPTKTPTKQLPRFTVRRGSSLELETLARLRRLCSATGLHAMQDAGCLAFTDDLRDVDADGRWVPTLAWIVSDPTGRNRSGRRLDGLPWKCCQGAKSRCLSGPGSKSWPVGLTLAKPGQRLDVAEGEGDFLALWHLHALAGISDAAPVGLLGSCTNLATFAPEIAAYVVGRIVQIFVHLDANGTGQAAARGWAESFYRLGAARVLTRNLTMWLGEGGGDLNDAIAADLAPRTTPNHSDSAMEVARV